MTVTSAPQGGLPRWQRSLLPAMLGADQADRAQHGDERLPRSARDWLVDVIIFLGSVGIGALVLVANFKVASQALFIADIVIGAPAMGALWVRRRYPFAVGLLTSLASIPSGFAAGASIAGMFTAAVYCPPRRTIAVFVVAMASNVANPAVYLNQHGHYDGTSVLVGTIITVVAVSFGSFVRARRELVLSLHERNRELQAEQHRRTEEARRAERTRIAREMHDVLAHRISLLSVHAGALEFNPDASPQEIARAAEVIRVSARAAQEELREVIGVLRSDPDERPPEPPQPTLGDLRALVRESRDAGMDVRLNLAVGEEPLPATPGRTVYRVVQEALTNVRKHAPGQVVTVEVSTDRRTELLVVVVNRPRVGRAAGVSDTDREPPIGAGAGLAGLAERVALASGTLTHGPLPDGGFAVRATLAWPGEAAAQ